MLPIEQREAALRTTARELANAANGFELPEKIAESFVQVQMSAIRGVVKEIDRRGFGNARMFLILPAILLLALSLPSGAQS